MTPAFAEHRARLLARLGRDEAVLVFGGPHHLRNGDSEYRYRPDSDVYWLTGWEDPEVAVFFRPGARPLTMFVQGRNPDREVYDGERPGPEGARDRFDADDAFEFSELERELPRLLQGVSRLHYAVARDAEHDALVMASIAIAARAARRNGLSSPETIHSLSVALHEVRFEKGEDEIALLRTAGRVSGAAHADVMAATRSGMTEYEIEAILVRRFLSEGSTGPGYVPIVAGGNNACTLHYKRNRDPLRDGDLLLVDAGCEIAYYTADITRTFPVGRRFTPAQRAVYEIVLAAQEAAIAKVVPGGTIVAAYDAATEILTEGLRSLGLLQGLSLPAAIASNAYRKWSLHDHSHWLGLDVHDVGAYGRDGEVRRFVPGVVLTIEPGLYFPATNLDTPEQLRGIGIRIEDDILVTDGAPEVLTASAPKAIADIEALR